MTRKLLHTLAVAILAGWSSLAAAHCDTLDGPVVAAAQRALESGQIEHALIWVQNGDERSVRDAFAHARAARGAGGSAAQKAEQAFYGTLVRVHRKGEGAPYTGLKPAGQIEPPVAAADRSLGSGQPAEVEKIVLERTRAGLRERFDAVASHRNFAPTDVEAGRAFVAAYVDYVHFVERVYDAAGAAGHAHGVEQHSPAAEPATPANRAGATAHGKHAH